jgi:hypothetical protein
MNTVLISIRDYVRLAVPEPEALRVMAIKAARVRTETGMILLVDAAFWIIPPTEVYNQNMADATQTVLTVGMPTLAVLVGILVNNARLSDLRGYIDNRFDALQQILDARFAEQKAELLRVEQVMDARLRHLEDER